MAPEPQYFTVPDCRFGDFMFNTPRSSDARGAEVRSKLTRGHRPLETGSWRVAVKSILFGGILFQNRFAIKIQRP